jgi:hypothetical protein
MLACKLKLEISYNRVMISLKGFWFLVEDFFLRMLYFCIVKYLNFHHSSFCLQDTFF